jgi:2Fe-2S ferredoxin
MPQLIYVNADGTRTEIEAEEGASVMQSALSRNLPGINGDCGGSCQCATCHCFVEEAWLDKLPPVEDQEDAMLDCTAEARRPNSRLSCMLVMSAALDGLTVHLPAAQ